MLNANNQLELVLATGILLGLVCIGYDTILHPWKMTLRHLAILMSALFFGLAPWLSLIAGNGHIPDEARDILYQSYATIALYILGIALIGPAMDLLRKRKERYSIWGIISIAEGQSWWRIIAIFTMVWAVRAYIAIDYGILFSGTGTEDRIKEIPYSIVVIQNILETLGYGCFIWAASSLFREEFRSHRLSILFIVLTGLAWSVTQGRRPMTISVAILFYCYCSNYSRMQVRHFVYGLIILALLIGFAFPNFLRLRMALDRQGGASENAVVELYQTVAEAQLISDEDMKSYARENMTERPLIIRFVCNILRSQEHIEPMHGDAMLRSVIWAVPSAIYGDKQNTHQTEQYIEEHYYQPLIDTSITWPAVGCADFGVTGGLFAGLLLGLLVYLMEWWTEAIKERYPVLAISVVGGIVTVLCNVEEDPLLLFCLIRASIILFSAVVILSWSGFLPKFVRSLPAIAESAD